MTTTLDSSNMHDHHFTTIDLDHDDNDHSVDQDWQEFNNFQFDVVLKYWNSLERKALDQGLPSLFPPASRRKDFISCMDKDKGGLLPTIEEGQEEPVATSPTSEKQIASTFTNTITPKMSNAEIATKKKGKSVDFSIPSLVEHPVIQTQVREDREKDFYPVSYSNPATVGTSGGEPPIAPLQGNQHLQFSEQEEDTVEKRKDTTRKPGEDFREEYCHSLQPADSKSFTASDEYALKESRDDDEESGLQSHTVVTIENVNDRDEEFDLLPTEEVNKGLLINTERVEEPIIFSGDGKGDNPYSEVSGAVKKENDRGKEDLHPLSNKVNPDSLSTKNRDEGRCTTFQRATSDSVLLSGKPDAPDVFDQDDSRGTTSSDRNLMKQTKVRGKRDKDPRLLQRAMSDHIITSTTSRGKHSSMAVIRTVSIQNRNSFLAKLVSLLKMRLSLWTKWKASAAGGHGRAAADKQSVGNSTPQCRKVQSRPFYSSLEEN